MRLHERGVFARFRYNDLKEAARDLRWMRALFTVSNQAVFETAPSTEM